MPPAVTPWNPRRFPPVRCRGFFTGRTRAYLPTVPISPINKEVGPSRGPVPPVSGPDFLFPSARQEGSLSKNPRVTL